MDFGDKIREIREKRGLSQKELAVKIGVAKSTYSLYESGKREPDVEKIKKIAKVLEVSGDDLLDIDVSYNNFNPILDTTETLLIEKYRSISDDGKTLINNILNFICENELDLTRAKMHEVSEEEFEYVQKIREFNEPSQEFIHSRIDDIYKKRDTFLVPEEKREAK